MTAINVFLLWLCVPQAETVDGVPANVTGDVFSKFDKSYGLVCLNKDQQGGICRNYRIRFLCGKLGMCAIDWTIWAC